MGVCRQGPVLGRGRPARISAIASFPPSVQNGFCMETVVAGMAACNARAVACLLPMRAGL